MYEFFDTLFSWSPVGGIILIGFALASGFYLFDQMCRFFEWLFRIRTRKTHSSS